MKSCSQGRECSVQNPRAQGAGHAKRGEGRGGEYKGHWTGLRIELVEKGVHRTERQGIPEGSDQRIALLLSGLQSVLQSKREAKTRETQRWTVDGPDWQQDSL